MVSCLLHPTADKDADKWLKHVPIGSLLAFNARRGFFPEAVHLEKKKKISFGFYFRI